MDERYNRIVQNEEFNRLLDEIEALEADRIYCRHGLEHLLDVARISYIQVLEDGLDYDKNILYAAALLHDIGRAAEYRDAGSHDEAGAVIAEGILRDCGYAESEIQMIQEAIRGHGEEGARDWLPCSIVRTKPPECVFDARPQIRANGKLRTKG